MGFEFVFKRDETLAGYLLVGVKGVQPEGEYGVLEIPSSYCGLPVIGILGIDMTPIDYVHAYADGTKHPPHFKHLILPPTIGYLHPCYDSSSLNNFGQIGRVDKLTLRGWTPRPGWMPVEYIKVLNWLSNGRPGWFLSGDIVATSLARCAVWADTVVFEGEEMPPRLFYGRKGEIKRVIAPNAKIIGEEAFFDSSVSEVELSSGLRAIGRGAFINGSLSSDTLGNKRLHLKIPSAVTYIGPHAFKPGQVDRTSLRGKEWEFEVPPRFDRANGPNGWYFSQGYFKHPWTDPIGKNLGERPNADAARLRIGQWLKAEDPNKFVPLLHSSLTDVFWASFKDMAMVCGANATPRGMFYAVPQAKY